MDKWPGARDGGKKEAGVVIKVQHKGSCCVGTIQHLG